MRKLCEIFNTRYFYLSWNVELDKIQEDIDIAECKFTTDTFPKLLKLQRQGFKVIDSADSDRNEQMLYNEYITTVVEKNQCTRLPKRVKNQSIKDYLSLLSKDNIYECNFSEDKTYQFAVIALTQITRPSIKFQLGTNLTPFITQVKRWCHPSCIREMINTTEDLLYLQSNVLRAMHFPLTEETITLYGLGEYTRETLAMDLVVVPASFGVEVLSKDERWSMLIQECSKVISNKLASDNNTIYNLIMSISSI